MARRSRSARTFLGKSRIACCFTATGPAIGRLRGRLDFDERFTEVVVVNHTKEASSAVSARRAADYLAGELRGQLLARKVEVVVEDRMARGRSPKSLRVRPPRFLGERLEEPGPVDVPGYPHAPVRLEVYLAGKDGEDGHHAPLALYAAGTMVAESFAELAALELDHAPWTDPSLTGLVDFSELRVAPGSRRGVIPDEVAHAFATALAEIEPVLSSLVETKERERAERLDKTVIRDLQRAFRDFYKKRPSYTMLPTEKKGEGAPKAVYAGMPAQDVELADAPFTEEENAPAPALFPPGPLDSVAVSPQRLVVAINEEATVRAKALDANGRVIPDGIELTWELWGQVGNLRELDDVPTRAIFVAGERVSEGILSAHAKQASTGREASAVVPVERYQRISGYGCRPSARPDSRLCQGPRKVEQGFDRHYGRSVAGNDCWTVAARVGRKAIIRPAHG